MNIIHSLENFIKNGQLYSGKFKVQSSTSYLLLLTSYLLLQVDINGQSPTTKHITYDADSILKKIYVSADGGSDQNDGTLGNPFKTINKALSIMTEPSEIVLADGTYHERIEQLSQFEFKIKGESRDGTILDGTYMNYLYKIFEDRMSHVTFENLTITKFGTILRAHNANVVFKNSIIEDNHYDYDVEPESQMLSIIMGGFLYINNSIIRNNHSVDYLIENSFAPLYIENSLMVNNNAPIDGADYGRAIMHTTEVGGSYIKQSTISNQAEVGIEIDMNSADPQPQFLIENSILSGHRFDLSSSTDFTSALIRNSIIDHMDETGYTSGVFEELEDGIFTFKPIFVDAQNGDFTLEGFSNAIGAGSDSVDLWNPQDIYGTERPNPQGSKPDLGAIEHELGAPAIGGSYELFFNGCDPDNPNYSIFIKPENGTSPYEVSLKDPEGNRQNGRYFSDLVPGVYEYQITDAVDSVFTREITLPEVWDGGYEVFQGQQMCMVTFDQETGKNKIIWNKAEGMSIAFYNIYKQTGVNTYTLLEQIAQDGPNYLVDAQSDPLSSSEKYKLTYTDDCGNESPIDVAEHHKTMYLAVNIGINLAVNLEWQPYEGFQYEQIRILRGSSLNDLEELTVRPADNNQYTDQNPSLLKRVYVVEAIHGNGCEISEGNSSGGRISGVEETLTGARSNPGDYTVTVIIDDLESEYFNVYPNPIEIGSTFSLKLAQTDSNYTLRVFNAQGQLVSVKSGLATGNASHSLDISEGIYIFQLEQKEQLYYRKIVIK